MIEAIARFYLLFLLMLVVSGIVVFAPIAIIHGVYLVVKLMLLYP